MLVSVILLNLNNVFTLAINSIYFPRMIIYCSIMCMPNYPCKCVSKQPCAYSLSKEVLNIQTKLGSLLRTTESLHRTVESPLQLSNRYFQLVVSLLITVTSLVITVESLPITVESLVITCRIAT